MDDRLSLSDRFHHASADVRSDAVRGGVFNMMSTDAFWLKTNNDDFLGEQVL